VALKLTLMPTYPRSATPTHNTLAKTPKSEQLYQSSQTVLKMRLNGLNRHRRPAPSRSRSQLRPSCLTCSSGGSLTSPQPGLPFHTTCPTHDSDVTPPFRFSALTSHNLSDSRRHTTIPILGSDVTQPVRLSALTSHHLSDSRL